MWPFRRKDPDKEAAVAAVNAWAEKACSLDRDPAAFRAAWMSGAVVPIDEDTFVNLSDDDEDPHYHRCVEAAGLSGSSLTDFRGSPDAVGDIPLFSGKTMTAGGEDRRVTATRATSQGTLYFWSVDRPFGGILTCEFYCQLLRSDGASPA